jgi:hypothetical protein
MAERMAHGPTCGCPLCIAQYTPPDRLAAIRRVAELRALARAAANGEATA